MSAESLSNVRGVAWFSVLSSTAEFFKLQSRGEVRIVPVTNPERYALHTITLTFKDQYLSSADMWRIRQHLSSRHNNQFRGRVVKLNEPLQFQRMHASIGTTLGAGQGSALACRLGTSRHTLPTRAPFRWDRVTGSSWSGIGRPGAESSLAV